MVLELLEILLWRFNTKKTILRQSRAKQVILAAKIFGLFLLNIMLFSLRTTDVKGRMVAIFRRSFSSILFWSPDINNEKEILPAKGKLIEV